MTIIKYLENIRKELELMQIQFSNEVSKIIQHNQTRRQLAELLFLKILYIDKLDRLLDEIKFISKL